MAEEMDRFDIDHIQFDKDGLPEIPRISFQVPKPFRAEFLQRMHDEVRSTPGEQLMAIFVQGMRQYRSEVQAVTKGLEGERRRIPVYGPKPSTSAIDQEKSRTAD